MSPVVLWTSIHDTIDTERDSAGMTGGMQDGSIAIKHQAIRFMDVRAVLYLDLVSYNKWMNPRLQRDS